MSLCVNDEDRLHIIGEARRNLDSSFNRCEEETEKVKRHAAETVTEVIKTMSSSTETIGVSEAAEIELRNYDDRAAEAETQTHIDG